MRATSLAWALVVGAPVDEPRAEPLEIDLSWSAPAECPDREAFLAATAELVGRELRIADDAEIVVDARVARHDSSYALELQVSGDRDSPRRFTAAQCDTLVEAGSLVVATRFASSVPAADTSTRVPEPVAPVEPRTPAAVENVQRPAPSAARIPPGNESAEPRPRPGVRAFAAVLGGVAFGDQPGPAGTLRGDLGILLPSARALVGVRHGFATTQREGDLGVRVSATFAHALGCWDPSVRRLDFPVCAGIELGALVGEGRGGELDARTTSRQLAVALPIEAGISWAIVPQFALRAGLGAGIGLRRPGFHVQRGGEPVFLFRMAPVAVFGLLGLEVRLP